MCGGWSRVGGTTVDLDPFLCVVPMMPKTSSVPPHSAHCSPFEVAHFHPQTKLGWWCHVWKWLPMPMDVLQRPLHSKKCTIGELNAAITENIRQIPKEECVRVIDNFARRVVQVCLQRRGQHIFLKRAKNYANWLRWLKLCGHIIHRLKFE